MQSWAHRSGAMRSGRQSSTKNQWSSTNISNWIESNVWCPGRGSIYAINQSTHEARRRDPSLACPNTLEETPARRDGGTGRAVCSRTTPFPNPNWFRRTSMETYPVDIDDGQVE